MNYQEEKHFRDIGTTDALYCIAVGHNYYFWADKDARFRFYELCKQYWSRDWKQILKAIRRIKKECSGE